MIFLDVKKHHMHRSKSMDAFHTSKKRYIHLILFIFLFNQISNYLGHNHSKSKPYNSPYPGQHSLYLHLIFLNNLEKGNYSCLILLGRTENKKSFFFCCKKLTNEIKTKRLWFLIYIYIKRKTMVGPLNSPSDAFCMHAKLINDLIIIIIIIIPVQDRCYRHILCRDSIHQWINQTVKFVLFSIII